ncbi:prevent-host-death family protein [Pseudomonas sp. FW306-1C-G01A]|nr:prevent-host-death family protein [Pseudomonas sp. GW101-1A09]PMV89342.1 prevent-host-death family protein [Pseudomonas sp. FW306-2-2C-B10A]PMW01607.1 prevent-host-death family protein [Pseudomonas sp. GW460-C8]PMW03704.1 prevent-host-death family protein [Pseudomonas sp. MPR-TSA4]PMW11133.1 prevent-host-death family protein [Pseudomonas sp. FW306-2-1A-C05A]PMW13530.1 prevent-host-death family protein [Pseudomonas sp. GW456-E6]PMW14431.1 prevent-host-death family protein [Pseudomonas sp. G
MRPSHAACLAERVISISELAKNAGTIVREAQDRPVAVIEKNQIKASLVSAELFETMLVRLGDFNQGSG